MSPEERRIDGESRERLTHLLDGLEQEKADNAEMRDIVIGSSRRMALLQWVTLAFAMLSIALGVTVGATLYNLHQQGRQRAAQQARNDARNTQAIEVSCTLLSNLAQQAGVIGTGSGASPAAKAQKVLVALVFDQARRGFRYHERYLFRKNYKVLLAAGPYVTIPKCSQVARHPETVKQLGQPKAQEKP